MAVPTGISLAKQAAQGVPKHILRQSLFYAFCPDMPDVLARRMEVRAKHLERVAEEKKEGKLWTVRALEAGLHDGLLSRLGGESFRCGYHGGQALRLTPSRGITIGAEPLLILEVFGLGYLPPSNSPLFSHPSVPPGKQPIAGSVMIFRQPSLEQMWKRIKEDVYWTEGIWDQEKCDVGEFLRDGGYVDLGED